MAEGGVGGGTGMSCCDFKGDIGTSSRVVPAEAGGFTVGLLVMSNFGRREHLLVDGVPVGQELRDWTPRPAGASPERMGSSIMNVLATDAPSDPHQLARLCVRAAAGLARTGGLLSTASGDFVIAFSTANHVPHVANTLVLQRGLVTESLPRGQAWPAMPAINHFFQAALEATEEAVLNSLFAADRMVGRDSHVRHALPIEETIRILRGMSTRQWRKLRLNLRYTIYARSNRLLTSMVNMSLDLSNCRN